MTNTPAQSRPPYLLGFLCLIPLVGAFVGLGLLLYGLLKYKDKWLSIIGAAGIVFTIVVYSALFGLINAPGGFTEISRMNLKELVMNIEFYNLQHGHYPDSLTQLRDNNPFAPVHDPIQHQKAGQAGYFHYEKAGDKYLLFSAGEDGIPNTSDDFSPDIVITDSSKIGWIPHR